MRINGLLERLSYGQKVQILKEFMEFRQKGVLGESLLRTEAEKLDSMLGTAYAMQELGLQIAFEIAMDAIEKTTVIGYFVDDCGAIRTAYDNHMTDSPAFPYWYKIHNKKDFKEIWLTATKPIAGIEIPIEEEYVLWDSREELESAIK